MGDWRETLFVWRGSLVLEEGSVRFVGSWLGHNGRLNEKLSEKEETPNTFSLTSSSFDTATASSIGTASCPFRGAKISWRGHYLLDNGAGLTRNTDTTHEMIFEDDGSSSKALLCVAKGANEYGKFISRGYLHQEQEEEGKTSYWLVLARRYVQASDSRWKSSLEQALADLVSESSTVASESGNASLFMPWSSLTLKAKASSSKKSKTQAASHGGGGGEDEEKKKKRRKTSLDGEEEEEEPV